MSKSCCKYQPAWCRCSHKEAEYTDCRHSKVSGLPRPEQNNPSFDAIVKICQQPRFICVIHFSSPFFVTFTSLDFFSLLREKITRYQVQECDQILLFPVDQLPTAPRTEHILTACESHLTYRDMEVQNCWDLHLYISHNGEAVFVTLK